MKKKLSALLMAGVMILGLAGCSLFEPSVTAESLIEGAKEVTSEYVRMDVDLSMFGTSEGTSYSMGFVGDYEFSGDVVHVDDMTITVDMSGLTMDITGEMWSDAEYSYINMDLFGMNTGWLYQEKEQSVQSNLFEGLVTDITPELEDHEKGEDYVVTWSVPASNLNSYLMDMGALESGNLDSDGVLNVSATFDEETKQLTTMNCQLSGSSGETEEMTITITALGGKTLSVPEDVKTEAVSAESSGW